MYVYALLSVRCTQTSRYIVDIARPHERVPFICNASDPTNSHPAGYMVDGLNLTHWQAKAGVDTANITIDLRSATQKVF